MVVGLSLKVGGQVRAVEGREEGIGPEKKEWERRERTVARKSGCNIRAARMKSAETAERWGGRLKTPWVILA